MEGDNGDQVKEFENVFVTEFMIKNEPVSDEEIDTQNPDEDSVDSNVVVTEEKEDGDAMLETLQPVCEINVKEEVHDETEMEEGACCNIKDDESQIVEQIPETSSSNLYKETTCKSILYKETTCKVCYKNFNDHEYFNHLLEKNTVKCNICDQIFHSKYNLHSLRYHVKKVHGLLPFCQYCYLFFLTVNERDEHRNSCNNCLPREIKLNPYPCDHCLEDFDTKFVLKRHTEEVHNCIQKQVIHRKKRNVPTENECISKLEKICKDLKYRNLKIVIFCSECSLPLDIKKYFGPHLHSCIKNSTLKCPFCKLNSNNKTELNYNLEEHIISKHIDNISEISLCDICKLAFFNLENYEMHKLKMHKKEICAKATSLFINKDKKSVSSQVTKKVPDDCYICSKCGEHVLKKTFTEHLKCHVFKCPFCTLLLPSVAGIRSHLNLNPNANTKCYEYFLSDPSAVYTNARSNAVTRTKIYLEAVKPPNFGDEIKNQCLVCYRPHQYPCLLIKHQQTMKHNIDIITCMVCSEKMCSELLLNYHSKSLHNNNKGIQCIKCIQRFTTLDKYILHFDNKHLESETECHLCYEIIKNESKRIKHRLKYHADGKFLCTICDSKFRLKQDLDCHKSRIHNMNRFKCEKCEALFSSKVFYAHHQFMCTA